MTYRELFKDRLKDLEITQVYLLEYLKLTGRPISNVTMSKYSRDPQSVYPDTIVNIKTALREIEARKNTCYDWNEGKLELLEEMKRKGVKNNGHKGNAKNRRGDRQARARKT